MKHIVRKYPYRRRISIEVSQELHNQLSIMAKKKGETLTSMVKKSCVAMLVQEWKQRFDLVE